MTVTNAPDVGVIKFPPAFEVEYLSSGIWQRGTIAEHFHDAAVKWPHNVAVVAAEGSLTYAELDEITDRRAAGLLELGLPVGGRALLQLHNRLSTVVAWYALLKAGLVPVCTLPLHRHHEIDEIGRQTQAVAHLVSGDDPKFDLVKFAIGEAELPGLERTVLVTGGEASGGATSFDRLGDNIEPARARATVAAVQARMDVQSVAVYQLSGGTTGVPKVIPCLQAAYWSYATEFAAQMQWTEQQRVAYLGPLVHNAGIVIGLHAPHSVGGALVLGAPDIESLFWTLHEGQASDISLGPYVYETVHDPRMADATNLSRVMFSGMKVAERHFDALEDRGIWGGQVFGMGEGLCAATPYDYPRSARLAGVGAPISAADEIRIYHPGTEDEVAPGEVGELCARGPYTTRGYLHAPDHNRVAFTSDGFYRTGDLLAQRVIDGVPCLTVEGRIKDMISRGGEKISTAEVEVLLISHPRIAEAAVVPMPDPRLGERACAFVCGAPGDEVTLDELRTHFESLGVAKYKWPERLVWLEEMPRASEVGKIDRRALREMAESLVPAPAAGNAK